MAGKHFFKKNGIIEANVKNSREGDRIQIKEAEMDINNGAI